MPVLKPIKQMETMNTKF